MMFLIQPISCIPTVISEKSLATTPSSSDHLTVGFLVRVFSREATKENNLTAVQKLGNVWIYFLTLSEEDTRFFLFLLKHMRFEMLSPSCRHSHSRGQLDMWSERCIVGSMAQISSGRMATSRPVTDFFSTLASSLYITHVEDRIVKKSEVI